MAFIVASRLDSSKDQTYRISFGAFVWKLVIIYVVSIW